MNALLTLLGLTCVAGLVVAAHRHPPAGIALLVGAFLASGYAYPIARPPHVQLGPVALYPLDLAVVIVLCAYLIRAAGGQTRPQIPAALWFLLGLLAVHTARGVQTYGLQVALNNCRPWWWFAVSAVYASTITWEPRLVRLLGWSGFAVLGVAAYGLVRFGVNSSGALRYVDGEFLTLRPLTSAGALLLLQLVALLAFLKWRFKAAFLLLAIPALVVAQQRTIWIAGLLLLPVAALGWLRRTTGEHPHRGYAAVGLTCLLLPVAVAVVTRSHALAASVQTAHGHTSTLEWRLSSWRALLGGLRPIDWLTGLPAGAPYTRMVFGQTTLVQPHSLYVESILRFGLLGVVAVIWVWATAARLVRAAASPPWPHWLGYLVVLSDLIFGITYGPSAAEGLVVGLVIAAAIAPAASRFPAERPVVAGPSPVGAR